MSGVNDDQRVALSMVHFLESQIEKMPEKKEDLEISIRHICAAFDFDHNDPDVFKSHSYYPIGLQEIHNSGVESLQATTYKEKVEKANEIPNFTTFVETVAKKGYFTDTEEGSVEYFKRHAKVVTKFQMKVDSAKANKVVDQSAQADVKKGEGNAFLTQKKYREAIACYSDAITLCPKGPSSHIYYCNRAAARCHIHDYREAIADCREAIACNNEYVKAYSRLGLAHYFLKEYDQSIAAYEEGLRLDPNNASLKDSLNQAKTAMAKEQAATTSQTTPPSGMPDLSSLAGMMGGLGGGGAGGMPDISKLMQNPQMMSMAQEMMKNPDMMQQAMNMMRGMGGGGGGMPDMSALAGMMGGLGGGAGGSSGGNGIPDFSGFGEDNK